MKRINLGERAKKRTEVNSTRNDITGDKIVSKSPNDLYAENWERIFGKKDDKNVKE